MALKWGSPELLDNADSSAGNEPALDLQPGTYPYSLLFVLGSTVQSNAVETAAPRLGVNVTTTP